MNKKVLILVSLAIFAVCFSFGSVSAIDNSTSVDNLNAVDDASSVDALNTPEGADYLTQYDNSNDVSNLTLSESSSDEKLALSSNSSDNILSSSVSVSSGHTFHKNGYTFKVSDSQYKKIKKAIKAGNKRNFLDYGFEFTVKTNKVVKVKVVVKKQTIHKKVRYAKVINAYGEVKLVNLKDYYRNGWKKYGSGYDVAHNDDRSVLGYYFVKLKKTVKTYKTVKMRVYATISYEGVYDYDGVGPQYFYPVLEFNANKNGYPTKFLSDCFLK